MPCPLTHHAQLLAARAAGMRSAPTSSEALLWSALSGSRLGVRFVRQVPLGRFMVDFFAPSVRLAVEVDGGSHAGREHLDARRDRLLSRLGVRVVRVPHALVVTDLAAAVGVVREALASLAAP